MLIRISLIIAILAGLAAGVLNFVKVKEVITTTRDTLTTTSNELVSTTATLRKTTKELEGTKAKLATTEETLRTTEDARAKAVVEAETSSKRAAELTDKLATTTRERDDARADLAAWRALAIPVEQVKTVIANLKEAQQLIEVTKAENRMLVVQVAKLQDELNRYRDPEYRVKLPENLKGKVLVSDPKWDFVVLDVGEEQGVRPFGELLLNRDGKLIAKIAVLRVDKNRSIANVVPGWKLGEVLEGDFAIPAF